MRVAVYRHFAADGSLLYVGVTGQPITRLHQQMERHDLPPLLASTTYEWFENRDLALRAEEAAIREEHPTFNVVHNVSPQTSLGVEVHLWLDQQALMRRERLRLKGKPEDSEEVEERFRSADAWLSEPCSHCGAERFHECRSSNGGTVFNVHAKRRTAVLSGQFAPLVQDCGP